MTKEDLPWIDNRIKSIEEEVALIRRRFNTLVESVEQGDDRERTLELLEWVANLGQNVVEKSERLTDLANDLIERTEKDYGEGPTP